MLVSGTISKQDKRSHLAEPLSQSSSSLNVAGGLFKLHELTYTERGLSSLRLDETPEKQATGEEQPRIHGSSNCRTGSGTSFVPLIVRTSKARTRC